MKSLISLFEWMKWYKLIINTMGFDPVRDRLATIVLASMLRDMLPPISSVEALVKGRVAVVFGAGPSLPHHIEGLMGAGVLTSKDVVVVAADGASKALLEHGVTPDIIVTDLDGYSDALIEAASKNSYMIIHGHGDNIDKIKSLVPRVKSITRRVIGTTQVEPIYPTVNFGGFTDGDRAVFITASMAPRAIVLAGMDFGDTVGKYSKPWLRRDSPAPVAKKKKLDIACKLLSWLTSRFKEIYSLSHTTIQGVKHVGYSDVVKLISMKK